MKIIYELKKSSYLREFVTISTEKVTIAGKKQLSLEKKQLSR
jgi:hypothetical protein